MRWLERKINKHFFGGQSEGKEAPHSIGEYIKLINNMDTSGRLPTFQLGTSTC